MVPAVRAGSQRANNMVMSNDTDALLFTLSYMGFIFVQLVNEHSEVRCKARVDFSEPHASVGGTQRENILISVGLLLNPNLHCEH